MKNYTKYLFLNLAFIFSLPVLTGLLDMMVWFVTDNTVSGLNWNADRYLITTASTFFFFVCMLIADLQNNNVTVIKRKKGK